jgi:hypothetical protein
MIEGKMKELHKCHFSRTDPFISAVLVPGLTGRVLRWLSPRLEAGRKNNV